MWSKPFKPPLLKTASKPTSQDEVVDLASSPPPKKRRLIHVVDDGILPLKPKTTNSLAANAPRKPLVNIPIAALEVAVLQSDRQEAYYRVLWYFDSYILCCTSKLTFLRT
jgi:hypothetical protein